MENIYETSNDFVFENIVMISPKNIQGGNYFIKFLMKDKPLYIQPPKCKTKNGIFKSAKKMYCDLMFTNENEKFIHWMENLENYCQENLFKYKDKWFETELDLHDIENSFTSPLKIYKSGKFYISRTNIPCILGKCSLKVYDEDGNEIQYETIKEDMNIMTILEIQGIKCSPRSFQIEIEMKQMMVMKPVDLFEKCIFHQKPKKGEVIDYSIIEKKEEKNIENDEETIPLDLGKKEIIENQENIFLEKDGMLEDVPILQKNEDSEILEIDFDLENLNEEETVMLKTKNDIYYKMYRDARQKAKLARDLAISSYLEAKDIKNKYKLDDMEDSENDSDIEKDLENTFV